MAQTLGRTSISHEHDHSCSIKLCTQDLPGLPSAQHTSPHWGFSGSCVVRTPGCVCVCVYTAEVHPSPSQNWSSAEEP